MSVIAGIDYGYLTTTGNSKSVNGHRKDECICVCGKRVYVRRFALTSGKTKSCGCKTRQLWRESLAKSLVKEKLRFLTPTELFEKYPN